VQISKLEALFL